MTIATSHRANITTSQLLYLELAKDARLWLDPLNVSLQHITETLSTTLAIARVSVWQIQADDALVCLDLFDAIAGKHRVQAPLYQHLFPDYFQALETGRLIDANDAWQDRRTSALTGSYLQPLGIGAMLGATLRAGGSCSGVLCLEHVGGTRIWTDEEKATAISISDLITQIFIHNKLLTSVAHYESLLANMPSAAYRCKYDKDWSFVYLSQGIRHITGYDADEIIDNRKVRFVDLIHPDDRVRVEEVVRQSLQGDNKFELEYRLFNKAGELCWVSEFGRVIRDGDGGAAYLDGVINDITQSKRAQAHSRLEQELILHISKGTAAAVGSDFFNVLLCELARALHIDYVFLGKLDAADTDSIEAISVFGHGKVQPGFRFSLRETPWFRLDCDEAGCVTESLIDNLVAGSPFAAMQVQSYISMPLYDSQAHVLGVLVALHSGQLENIELSRHLLSIFAVRASTELERQLKNEEIQRNEQRYRALFNAAGDAIFIMQDDKFVDCNPRTLQMFGCKAEQIIGESPYRFSPPLQPDGRASRDKALELIRFAFADRPQTFEWRHVRYNGTEFDAEVTLKKVDIDNESFLLASVRDITERKLAERAVIDSQRILEFQARHDPLTQLPNRVALHEELRRRIHSRSGFALCLLDLDRFKEVNDTLGHNTGDKLIMEIGPRLEKALAGGEHYLSRLGGDEFAVILSGASQPGGYQEIVERMIEAIRQPFTVDGVTLELGGSVGIAIYPDDGVNNTLLLQRADIAMYHAKNSSIDYAFYDGRFDNHTKEKLAMMGELRSAIFARQFQIFYQPKVSLATGMTVGFEGLIRWLHPRGKLILPADFISLVEMTDIIHPITDQVMEMALQQLAQWQCAGLKYTLAINVSTRNLLDRDFYSRLLEIIDEYNVDASRLEIEITESALISDPPRVSELLRNISRRGIKVTIDDFGTGYSSLSYLKDLPINALKIDRSFVTHMHKSSHDQIIVRSTINLAHNLGLEVVAEGVEHEECLQLLKQMNCDLVQGFLIQTPMAPEQLPDYVLRSSIN